MLSKSEIKFLHINKRQVIKMFFSPTYVPPSGTAPNNGKTTPPTNPAIDGINKSNSLPSLIKFDA